MKEIFTPIEVKGEKYLLPDVNKAVLNFYRIYNENQLMSVVDSQGKRKFERVSDITVIEDDQLSPVEYAQSDGYSGS